MDNVGIALVVGGMAFLFSGLVFLIPVRGSSASREVLSKIAESASNAILARTAGIVAKSTRDCG